MLGVGAGPADQRWELDLGATLFAGAKPRGLEGKGLRTPVIM